MSIEIILIPIALTAAAGWIAKRSITKKSRESICFETQFKDSNLLQKALNDFGCSSVRSNSQIQVTYDQIHLVFELDESGIFVAYSSGEESVAMVQSFLTDLHDQYKRQLQQQSYDLLLQRAAAQGMVLESEEIEDDNSIVLTFTVS